MSGSGRVALPDIRVWSGGPPGCPGVVGMLFRVVGMISRVAGRPSRMFGSGLKSLSDVQE